MSVRYALHNVYPQLCFFPFYGTMYWTFVVGVVMLDLEAYGLSNIFHAIVEQLVISDQIEQENQGNVLRVLMLKHK